MRNYDKAFQKLIDEGYEFKTNQYLKDGLNIFNKNMGNFVGFFAIYFVLSILTSIPLKELTNQTFASINFFIEPFFIAGALLVINDIILKKEVPFSRFFDGIKFFFPLLLLSIITAVFSIIGLIFLIIPGVYLLVGYSFSRMFVIFFGYDIRTSMELSRKIIQKRWWDFFGFLLILGGINLLGLIPCGIGILFTVPITTCMTYCAFEDIIGGAIREYAENDTENKEGNEEGNEEKVVS